MASRPRALCTTRANDPSSRHSPLPGSSSASLEPAGATSVAMAWREVVDGSELGLIVVVADNFDVRATAKPVTDIDMIALKLARGEARGSNSEARA